MSDDTSANRLTNPDAARPLLQDAYLALSNWGNPAYYAFCRDDDEQDVERLTSKYQLPDNLEPEMRAIERELSDLMGGGITVCDVLRTAIRAALDDEWDKGFRQAVTDHVELVENIKALRECRERLERSIDKAGDYLDAEDYEELFGWVERSSLADDLRPRGGDEQ